MGKVRNGEDLRQRLVIAAGEEVVAWGWGTLGVGSVLTGVTASAVVLEFVTMGMNTKEIRRIPFEELEFIHAAKGDASNRGFLGMNMEAGMADSMTGTLVLKAQADDLMFIKFSRMPRQDRNDGAPFRITEHITRVYPEKVYLPDLSQYGGSGSSGGCLKTFMIISPVTAVLTALAMGLGTGEWDLAIYGGIGTGVIIGAAVSPLVSLIRRMFSRRG